MPNVEHSFNFEAITAYQNEVKEMINQEKSILQKEHKELVSKQNQLTQRKATLVQKIADLNSEIQSLNSQLRSYSSTSASNSISISHISAKLTAATAALNQAQAELPQVEADLAAIADRLPTLADGITKLDNAISETDNFINQLMERINATDANYAQILSALNESINNYITVINDIESTINASELSRNVVTRGKSFADILSVAKSMTTEGFRITLVDATEDEIGRRLTRGEDISLANSTIESLNLGSLTNPYDILAWMNLMGQGQPDGAPFNIGNLSEAVQNGIYSNFGITAEDISNLTNLPAGTVITEENKAELAATYPFQVGLYEAKKVIYALPDQNPIPGFSITTGIGGYRGHVGVDFSTNKVEGFNIYATTGGQGLTQTTTSGYGKHVVITDSQGNRHVYGHMSNNAIINDDRFLLPGELIGLSGNTGKSTGAHLHYEVQSNGSKLDNKTAYQPASEDESEVPGYKIPTDFMP